ncbi:MAG: DUF669 domain-containing protein [Eubacteriaceae bacterium]|nr:DUF669 domain-containing protein [Eubacteriaceae bacterium]
MSTNEGRAFDWEDEVEQDGPEFITVPEGDYDFEVVKFERARYAGGNKLPACNQAIIYIKVETPEGQTTIKHNLYLHTITEGMICSFLTGIGQRKHGEKVVPRWGEVMGSTGRCRVGIHSYEKDGETRTNNEIKKFYEPGENTPKNTGFTAGSF